MVRCISFSLPLLLLLHSPSCIESVSLSCNGGDRRSTLLFTVDVDDAKDEVFIRSVMASSNDNDSVGSFVVVTVVVVVVLVPFT